MGVPAVVADMLSFVGHHMTETGLVISGLSFMLAASSQIQSSRTRRKTDKEAKARAVDENRARELERSNSLIATLREIGDAKDAIVLEQAVTQGRRIAKEPAQVEYQISLDSIYDPNEGFPRIPSVDKSDERYLVERKYYGNQYAKIPEEWNPLYPPNGFPRSIPKEWFPSLVNEIIGTLPARYPSYYSIAEGSFYGNDAPRSVIRRVACLADAVEQRYLHVSTGAICTFIVSTYRDHWSKLPQMIRSVLVEREGNCPNLAVDLLYLAASGEIKAYWPQLVRLAVIQGVSESICWMGDRIPEAQKAKLASAYISLLHQRQLDGLGPHRLFHDSEYCHLSYSTEERDSESKYIRICRLELAEDHVKGHLSIDRTLAYAVLAMGFVCGDSLSDRASVMEYLPRAFESYRRTEDYEYRMINSEMDIRDILLPTIHYDCARDFTEGVYKLARGKRTHPLVCSFLDSAKILVPDIIAKLDELEKHDDTEKRAEIGEDGEPEED
ncbi:hypothetical protein PP404_20600 [Mycobacteroides abscessus]|nr:hypothetical protein [Mycobacteroides abscessus]MDM2179398.1 hypothetical protein [Mycobacteroides abscessus]MDM2214048.1 hypothetical protein [Mycobacteroides abscessus]MDM2219212.1 hypothetical protein [Mycobacteroides abscessus]MDM2223797.1 hypothetical protein [Mycobacteroides abscessus]